MTPKSALSSLALVLVGVAAGYPLVARAKGQLCSARPEEGRRMELTIKTASVDGVPTPNADATGLHLKTEFYRDDMVHAVVAEPKGGTRVIHVQRLP